MAKRYKNEASKKSNSHQKTRSRSEEKKGKGKVFIFFIIIIILIAGYFIITNLSSSQTNNQVRISNSDRKITSDMLVLKDLNNEVIENLTMENMQLVRAHYKLENLETGTINLYYKVDDKEVIKVDINIKNKKIEKVERQENAEEMSLPQIGDNINKDIKEYFTENQERLKPEEGKSILNVIVEDEQIIINASDN